MQSFKELRFNYETRTLTSWRWNIQLVKFNLMEFPGVGNGLVAESKKCHSKFRGKIFYFLVL